MNKNNVTLIIFDITGGIVERNVVLQWKTTAHTYLLSESSPVECLTVSCLCKLDPVLLCLLSVINILNLSPTLAT
jgi:hypothetical protein